jgi:hypothetical protein
MKSIWCCEKYHVSIDHQEPTAFVCFTHLPPELISVAKIEADNFLSIVVADLAVNGSESVTNKLSGSGLPQDLCTADIYGND